ncbi:prephenate dehydratase [Halovivax gelatinilyticus]|uniref:prephenate dehydratase n=1 Tax=Halovivax gelatinilyticus TaxID=2961597 RepID=UPI0020CA8A37|nr:prephenate dehydratase [Halovivax gelatinilyticus]
MTVRTLGPAGTYSHRAARTLGEPVSFERSVTAIVDAVARGDVSRGVVPIENSIEGSVTETSDALVDAPVAVVGELVLPIRHALLAQTDSFDAVASHPQALAQCRETLDRSYPDLAREAVTSTAAGVERAREDDSVAAIAHPDAADELRVIDEDVQDRSSNRTRFFVLASGEERTDTGSKSTVVIAPGTNHPGLLFALLEPFADRDVNLTRIESRPTGRRLGEYEFHLDLEAALSESRTQAALGEIESVLDAGQIHRLGSYDVTLVE